jgi:PAS domain S-box-containing protein
MPRTTIPGDVVFEALLDESLENIYVIDADLRYVRVSRGGARDVGLTPEQMAGRTWRELGLPAGTMEPLEAEWRQVLATGERQSRRVEYNRCVYDYAAFPVRAEGGIVGVVAVARDVTARERYQGFVANSSEAIWRFELDEPIDVALPVDEQIDLAFARGYLAECNDVMARQYGFASAAEIVGARLPDMLDPSQKHNRAFIRAFIEGGYRIAEAESRETDRFGNPKYFMNSFTGIVENGKLIRAWGTQRDVTEQRLAMDAIRFSEQRLQALVAASAQVVWTAEASGEVKTITPSWTELTGQSQEDAQRFGWLEHVHPDDREEMTEAWREAMRGRDLYRHAVRFCLRDRTWRYYEIRSAPVLDEDGRIREWVGSCTDVDAQRKQDEALAVERTRADFIVEANDLFTRSLDYEKTLRSLAAITVPRLADWCAVDMLEPDGTLRRLAVEHPDPEMVRLAFELEQKYPSDPNSPYGAHEVARTGRTSWLKEIPEALLEASARSPEHLEALRKLRLRSFICAPIKVRDRVAGVLTLVNSDRSRTYDESDVFIAEELALRAGHAVENARLYQQAVEANRAKDEFLATLSHELRTPLTSILGWAHLVRMSGYDMENVRTAFETIERSARTQAALIDDLLDVSRIVTGKLRLNLSSVDIVPIVRDVVASSHPAAEAKGITIELRAPESAVLRADPNRLQQIVWNLVSNAVKFSMPETRVEVEVAASAEQVTIRVRDEGVGIAPEVLPRVFERFWQADSSPDRAHGGLGLGLAIVKQIAELHGGTVSADSAGLGGGATFTITLPVRREQPPVPAKRVLLVDDDADARNVVRRTLELYGATVAATGSASEAVEMAARERFDLILTDLAMPGQDGYWLLDEIRRRRPEARVCVVTAYGQSEEQLRAAGFNCLIRKPVEPEQLAELLR